ncbi:hypothetical protein JXM83_02680 [Candidatus Woesearchaeota archaeon]|nr:hypothetical protein [Candidatus Woesearchaeota archaeon]
MNYIQKLVVERLSAMPPNVSFSIGGSGDFTRDQLIQEVNSNSKIGKVMMDMQIEFIKRMPNLIK